MNSDELAAIARQILTTAGASAVASGYLTQTQLVAVVGAIVTLGSVAWTIYSNWNQRKVHETAVVTSTAPTVAQK